MASNGLVEDSFDLAALTKMYDFTGKTVAITGGTGVLGSEIARALAGCGAQVAILGRNEEAYKALVERLGERGKQLSFFKFDAKPRECFSGCPGYYQMHGQVGLPDQRCGRQ